MIRPIYSTLTLAFITGAALMTPATAQSITGSATVSGNITISATGIIFNTNVSNTVANPLTPGSPNSGSFAGLSSGAIKNLAGLTAAGPLAVKSFATFNTSSGTIIFDLQSVAPGTGSPADCTSAVGSVCTSAGSALTLIQSSVDSVGILVTLNGIAYPATAGPGLSRYCHVFNDSTLLRRDHSSVSAIYRRAYRLPKLLLRHAKCALILKPVTSRMLLISQEITINRLQRSRILVIGAFFPYVYRSSSRCEPAERATQYRT